MGKTEIEVLANIIRRFESVNDVADAIESMNIWGDEEIRVNEIIDRLAEEVGYDGVIEDVEEMEEY